MKSKITLLSSIFFLMIFDLSASFGQTTQSDTSKIHANCKGNKSEDKGIETEVFTIDLGTPSVKSVKAKKKRNALWSETNQPISFQLINGNPFKYNYIINTSPVNLFENNTSTPIEDYLKNASLVKGNSTATEHAKDSIKTLSATFSAINLSLFNSQNDTTLRPAISKLKIPTIDITATDKGVTTDNLINGALVILQTADDLNNDIGQYTIAITNEDFLNTRAYNEKKSEFFNKLITIKEKLNNLNQNIELGSITDSTLNAQIGKINNDISQISTTLNSMLNIQQYYYTLPNDINGKNIDLLKITVERHDKKTNALIDKNDYQIWIKGGLKLDISAGLFLTSLHDDKYFTIDSTSTLKKIYKSNTGQYGIGLGSMLNISYRTGSAWIKPAISFGALVSASQEFQGLAGFSFILGKEERAVLHFGLSFGSTTNLENSYSTFDSTGKVYSLGTSNQVPTTQKINFGRFFGFTYNISGTKTSSPTGQVTAAN